MKTVVYIKASLNIIEDASIIYFFAKHLILYCKKNTREIYHFVMNKYRGQSFCQFGLQNSQPALKIRWQVAVKRGGRRRVI